MLKLKLDFPYKIIKTDIDTDTDKQIEPVRLSINLLHSLINAKYITQSDRGGNVISMNRKDGRLWGRISDKLEDAIIDKKKEIELAKSEFDFLYSVFSDEQVNVHPSIHRHLNILNDEINKLKIEADKL